jgi:maltooligosyltrehalose trehalohydrolase
MRTPASPARSATGGWDPGAVPDPQAQSTFEASKLRWDEVSAAPHDSLLSWYRELIELRRKSQGISDPRLESVAVEVDDPRGTLVVRRGDITVMANLGVEPATFAATSDSVVLAASDTGVRLADELVQVPVDAVAIVGTRR